MDNVNNMHKRTTEVMAPVTIQRESIRIMELKELTSQALNMGCKRRSLGKDTMEGKTQRGE